MRRRREAARRSIAIAPPDTFGDDYTMPIYDYRCDHCGHAFSRVLSYSEGPVEACPNCGKKPRKLLVAPAVVFKGSGWYKTDSRGAAPKEGDSATAAKKDDAKDTKDTKKEESKKSDAPAPSSNASTKSEASS